MKRQTDHMLDASLSAAVLTHVDTHVHGSGAGAEWPSPDRTASQTVKAANTCMRRRQGHLLRSLRGTDDATSGTAAPERTGASCDILLLGSWQTWCACRSGHHASTSAVACETVCIRPQGPTLHASFHFHMYRKPCTGWSARPRARTASINKAAHNCPQEWPREPLSVSSPVPERTVAGAVFKSAGPAGSNSKTAPFGSSTLISQVLLQEKQCKRTCTRLLKSIIKCTRLPYVSSSASCSACPCSTRHRG